ncbi:MAG: hemolysin III family protein [Burkholderiales bacterium]|nr:hemolysin III family protein [Phycisphaerae bacterium]
MTPRRRIGRWVKEPFCGLSHGLGAVLSLIGLVVLLVNARQDSLTIAGVAVYGISMVVLYTASFLVHSVRCSARIENRLERIDYAAIFFLIAGTYTPVCLSTLPDAWGWTILAAEWALAIIGATMVLLRGPGRAWVMLYVPMGWLVLVAAVPILQRMQTASLLMLLAGGVIYSVGAVVFVLKKPSLLPGRFGYHDLWHVLVMAASGCHFVAVLLLTSR